MFSPDIFIYIWFNASIFRPLRASLETSFFQGIFIFSSEISLFSLGKIEIPLKNGVPKLALIVLLQPIVTYYIYIYI